jgi:hypothetical protein
MPKPPNIDDLDKVNFIVNYALVGCAPPFWLFIDLAKEPAGELALLLLAPDIPDIVQTVLQPGGARGRDKGRHGRKSPSQRQRRRPSRFPDTSELFGQKIRSVINPYDALDFAPTRFAFRLINITEGIAITAAVLGKLTDILFDPLYGIVTINPDFCREFSRISKTKSAPQLIGGGGSADRAFHIDHVEVNVGFVNQTLFTSTGTGDFNLAWRATVYNPGLEGDVTVRGLVKNLTTGETFEGFGSTIAPFRATSINAHGNAKKGEELAWQIRLEYGFAEVTEAEVLAYKDTTLY